MSVVRIYSVTHKKYRFPDDKLYTPIQVGFDENIGVIRDSSGENISSKNKEYCELTAIYWVWKNIEELDYVGFDHYRRHFCVKRKIDKYKSILTLAQVTTLLEENKVILPKKRKYYIETNYSQYIHAHHKKDIDTVRTIICEKYPYYVNYFDEVMKKRSGHRFNMFIMPWIVFDSYCEWLFTILFELEGQIDISNYTENDKRVYGFIAERLLDVYVSANHIQTQDIPYMFMEKQDWVKKIYNFIKRKYNR